jgi:hypothetical protein
MKFAVKAGKLIFRMQEVLKRSCQSREKKKVIRFWRKPAKIKRNTYKRKISMAVAIIKRVARFYCLIPLPIKNIRKPVLAIASKGSTVNLKDFKTDAGVVEGLLFDDNFKLILEPKKTLAKAIPDELTCPKCQKELF